MCVCVRAHAHIRTIVIHSFQGMQDSFPTALLCGETHHEESRKLMEFGDNSQPKSQ